MSVEPRANNPAARSAPLSGRAAAAIAVESALCGRGFARDVLGSLRQAGRLAPREAALATHIALGALRHIRTIRHVLGRIGRYDPQRTPPRVQSILYGAAYQMIWMERVPLFAAADEAVTLTRKAVAAGAARMVNALLRKLSGAIEERQTRWIDTDPRQIRVNWEHACAFNRDVLPIGRELHSIEARAVLTGETPERMRALAQHWGGAAATAIAWASQAIPPIVVQRNTKRVDPAAFRAAVLEAGGTTGDCGESTAFISTESFRSDTPLIRDGLGFVQDTTAAAAAQLVAARPRERVLDLCAAPGGKSIALALAMQDRGEVLACDIDTARLARIEENAARLGLSSIHTRPVAVAEDFATALGQFDAALLDVPCSNTGVIARRPEARLGFTPQKLAALVRVQTDLLQRAAACVRTGGRLVYSTCSIEPDENEAVVSTFLRAADGWRLAASQTTQPRWGPRLSDWRDGGFAASLERA